MRYGTVVNTHLQGSDLQLAVRQAVEVAARELFLPVLEAGANVVAADSELEWAASPGVRGRRFRASAKNLRRLLDEIKECDSVESVGLYLLPGPQSAAGSISLNVDTGPRDDTSVASQFLCGCDVNLLVEAAVAADTGEALRSMLSVAKQWAVIAQASTGAFDTAEDVGWSRLEEDARLDQKEVLRDCDRYVRGIYWGLFLGPQQIARLGGVAAVATRFGADSEDLSADGQELMFVHTPGTPEEATTETYTDWERTIRPVLRRELSRAWARANLPAGHGLPPSVRAALAAQEAALAAQELPAPTPSRVWTDTPDPNGGTVGDTTAEATYLDGWEETLPDLDLIAVFGRDPTEPEIVEMERLFSAWLRIGQSGGFGGWIHDGKGAVVRHGTDAVLEMWVDLGSTDLEMALAVLIRSLHTISQPFGGLEEIVVGHQIIE